MRFLTGAVDRCRRLLLLAVVGCGAVQAAAASAAPAPAAIEPRRVVVLMDVDPALPAMRQFDDAFRVTLQADSPGGATFFTETLDTVRFDRSGIAPEFLALQRKKYSSQSVDLVVGVGDGSADFIRDHGRELWPGASVLLTALDDARVDVSKLAAGAAFLLWRLDVDGTLDTIEALQPASKRLLVVGGSAEFDRALTQRVAARAAARSRWQTESWTTFSVEELRSRLATLDNRTAVVFTSMHRDADGRATFPVDALARLAETSGAPIYGLYGTYIGRGAAAGSVVDFADSGRRTAEFGAALLKGQSVPAPGSLPLTPTRCIADYNQLQAHRLPVSALPAGCLLRNPPRNLWTEYRGFVLAAASVVLLQTLTIGALVLQLRRRRDAEADALQRRTELSRAMRFAAIGELTASIAHEINQPLGAILSNADAAEMLLEGGKATPENLREILAAIRRDDMRAHEVIRRLRALLEKHEVEHHVMQLHPVLDDVLALLASEARRRGMTIERAFGARDDRVLGDPIQVQQVLLNLAINAMEAMDDTEPASRRLLIETADRGDSLELSVADRGSGIDASKRSAVFESFYTTKPRGLGLGLPIVRAIVEAHHGRIEVTAREGGGAVFTVTMPRRLVVHPGAEPSPSAALLEGHA